MAKRQRKPSSVSAMAIKFREEQDRAARRIIMHSSAWDRLVAMANELNAKNGTDLHASELIWPVVEHGLKGLGELTYPIPFADAGDHVARRGEFPRKVLDKLDAIARERGVSAVDVASSSLEAYLGRGARSNPLLAIVGNPGPSSRRRRGGGGASATGKRTAATVFNVDTGELRQFSGMGAEYATAVAYRQDNPGSRVETARILGHARTGPWCGRFGEANADPMGRMWARLLDTIHYSMLSLSRQQAKGSGVASITFDQWARRFAQGKSQGAKDKAWSDMLKFIREQDAKGYGISADRRPGWLDLNINNAFDAAWIEQPGTQHQLGFEREADVLRSRYSGFELAGRLADREDFYASQEFDEEPAEHGIPGGSMEAYRARILAERGVADPEEAVSLNVERMSNPQEKVAKRPREESFDVDEFKDHLGFNEAWDDHVRWHDADPRQVIVYVVDNGSDEETWEPVHSFLHETIETNYTVPKGMGYSNKHQGANPDLYPDAVPGNPGTWTHKHYRGKRRGKKIDYPVEVKHPFTDTTRKILRGSALDGWWHS